MRHTLFSGVLLAGLTIFTAAAAAQSLPSSTFVSSTGGDQNDCSRTSPCRTFQGALDKTAPNGTVTALTPGEYGGTLSIDKAITIVGLGPSTRLDVPATQNGIAIDVGASDQVNLIGLHLNGRGTGSKAVYMNALAGGKLTITDCLLAGFTSAAVYTVGGGETRILVRDTLISNVDSGVAAQTNSAVIGLVLDNVTIDMAKRFGLFVSGATVVAAVSNTDILRTATGMKISNGATVTSYGNNRIRSGDAPTKTIPTN